MTQLSAEMIAQAIHAQMPDADIEIDNMRGDGTYYKVTVTARDFRDHNRLDQHRMVFAALGSILTDDMREQGYAVSLKTIAT